MRETKQIQVCKTYREDSKRLNTRIAAKHSATKVLEIKGLYMYINEKFQFGILNKFKQICKTNANQYQINPL